jgi:hypothetical protein
MWLGMASRCTEMKQNRLASALAKYDGATKEGEPIRHGGSRLEQTDGFEEGTGVAHRFNATILPVRKPRLLSR